LEAELHKTIGILRQHNIGD